MTVRPKKHTMEKMFGYAFTHLNQGGASATVDQFDGDFFSDLARNLAVALKIPLVLLGLGRAQTEKVLGLRWFEMPPEFERSQRQEVAGIPLRDVCDADELKSWWNGTLHAEADLPRVVFPNYVWDLDEGFVKQEVVRLGLIRKGFENPLLTNSELILPMIVSDFKKLGYCSFEPEFARMIREGKANRNEWRNTFEFMEFVVSHDLVWNKGLDAVLGRLGLKRTDLC
jgi:hypothetical protein